MGRYLIAICLFSLALVHHSLEAGLYETLGIGHIQSTSVRGVLMCEGKPAANVKVKLYDVDSECTSRWIRQQKPLILAAADPDDLMAEGVSNNDGEFEL